MAITYDINYFNNGGGIGGYDAYSDHTYADETAAILADKYIARALALGIDLSSRKVLIVGCAYGYTVKYLVGLGIDAYGMDISTYAISKAPFEITDRLLVGDVRLSSDFNNAKVMAGIAFNKKFDVIFDDTSSASIDFTLSATISDLTNYIDGNNVISCRVYQLAI